MGACEPERTLDRWAIEQLDPRFGCEAAQLACEGTSDEAAGPEHTAGADHRHAAARPAHALEQSYD
jgi:hypothetical protein